MISLPITNPERGEELMNRQTGLVLFLCLGTEICHAQESQSGPERLQIEGAERAVGKAIGMRDFATVERLWSPQMLVNSPGNRVLTREQVIAAIHEDKLSYSGYTNEIEAFHLYGDIAVLMGNETLIPNTGPEAGTRLYRRYTDIWQRTNGSWVQIARQATYTDDKKIHYNNKEK
jgi:hypothetical protein